MKPKTDRLAPDTEALILRFLEIADKTPRSPAALKYERDILEGNLVACPITGIYYNAREVRNFRNRAGVLIRDFTHPGERAQFRGMCPIACIKCRAVVAWTSPGKDRDGFKTVRGEIYHIHCCPKCEPEKFGKRTVETPLIEKQLYLKYR